MDSESAAQASAQQKHHKHMMFGKKQRYIEVFQCSGEDMNMVLNGGLYHHQYQSSPAIAKPLASGMLPSRPPQASNHVQPLQVSIPPPLSIPLSLSQAVGLPSAASASTSTNSAINANVASANHSSNSSSLIAQQQQTAHFIAQQNLMARQQAAAAAAQLQAVHQHSADQMAFLQNFSFLPSSGVSAAQNSNLTSANQQPTNPYAFPYANQQVPQFFYLPRPHMLPMSIMPGLGQMQQYAAAAGYVNQAQLTGSIPPGAQLGHNHISAMPQTTTALSTTSVKRSYESAFRNDPMNAAAAAAAAAAKRAYHPNQSHTTNIYGSYPYP
jgi:epithelial splicing regulatory protein 1/2